MATKKEPEKKKIAVLRVEVAEAKIVIKGTTPLIVHAWSDKAKRMMLDKMTGVAKAKKHDVRIPWNDFIDSLHWLTPKPKHGASDEEAKRNFDEAVKNGAKFGFSISGIKQSMVLGAIRTGMDAKGTELRGTMYLQGTGENSNFDYAEIVTKVPPRFREDTVNVGGMSKSADLRYRAQFDEWEIPLKIRFNKNGKYSIEQLLATVNMGGFAVGIGEWRPDRDGQYGMYELKEQHA